MSEKPGTLIGLSNVMTRATVRVATGPDLDATPGLRDRLRTNAMRALEGRESFIHDAIVMGRRVRLFSNSHHLGDFWKDNWLGEGEWRAITGKPVPRDPALSIHAMIGVAEEPEASYLSVSRGEAYLVNTSHYGNLRALAMEALGRAVAAEGRLLHGAAVEVNGRTLLLFYPKEVIHPTPTWGLLEVAGSKLLGDGWLFLDTGGRLHAVERDLYARVSFVESYPEYAARLLRSKFENVPDIPPALADLKMAAAQETLEAALRSDSQRLLQGLPPDRRIDYILRLIASPDARAMVDPSALLGKSRLTRGPASPSAVFALKAQGGEPLRPTTLEPFACPCFEVNLSAISGHPREAARLIAAR
jgi:hypothetical protein